MHDESMVAYQQQQHQQGHAQPSHAQYHHPAGFGGGEQPRRHNSMSMDMDEVPQPGNRYGESVSSVLRGVFSPLFRCCLSPARTVLSHVSVMRVNGRMRESRLLPVVWLDHVLRCDPQAKAVL